MREETKEFWRQWGRNLWATRSELGRAAVSIAIMVAVVKVAEAIGPTISDAVIKTIGPHKTKSLIGATVVLAGFGAHQFKRCSQLWYGIVECCFGIVSGFTVALSLFPEKPWLPQGATLVGCAYVIARGLNNMTDARMKVQSIANEESA